jgi:translation initiation factor 4G
MLSEEYYIAAAAKRRGLGLVKFIGELYKLGMLTERIMHECTKRLLDFEGVPEEAEVESLCNLLRTIGASLDASEKGPAMMDAYFARINHMIDMPGLPSRLKFMLMVRLPLCALQSNFENATNLIFFRTLPICVLNAGSLRTLTRAPRLSNRFARRFVLSVHSLNLHPKVQ